MNPPLPTIPADLIDRLAGANDVVAFTGAGVSAESGVPTFRGPEGIWSKFNPEELASMEAFMKNPALVWEWYTHRRTIISAVAPNPGHRALAEMEKVFPRMSVVTQNIDNLHRRAGSKRVFELHGNIERSYCMLCGKPYPDVAAPEKGKHPSMFLRRDDPAGCGLVWRDAPGRRMGGLRCGNVEGGRFLFHRHLRSRVSGSVAAVPGKAQRRHACGNQS